jgi:hypothetical protein
MIHSHTVMKCDHITEEKELKKEDKYPQESILNCMNRQNVQSVNP